ncbi:TMhelix containing protein [Vibrio phage vB_VhaS_R21Y]|nr:TMhelix containing protein [Vibrio phage vB_VcaS_HC]WKV32869.1 TMhelix containing protein [Vibrio phage vB_VhaS_R21Y]
MATGLAPDIEAKSVNGWIVKIIAFIVSMCFIGLCYWVTVTTFNDHTTLQLMNQKFDSALMQREKETTELTNKLVGVADQLSQVSTNLAQVSASLYTKEDAAKEAQRVNAELNHLKIKQAQIQGSIDYKQKYPTYQSAQ